MTQATPDSPLLAFVLAALTAMFAPSLTDIGQAQRAAREAITAHQARGETDWLAVGQIVSFAVTVLDSQRLSMATDTKPAMKLKLRANANAANRAARTIADRMGGTSRALAIQEAAEPEPPAPELTGQGWASGMLDEAARLQAQAADVSPEQHKTDALWIDVLTGMAKELTAGQVVPSSGKAALLRSTWMAGDPGIPSDPRRRDNDT